MRWIVILLGSLTAACTVVTDTDTIESCYQTAEGLTCVDTADGARTAAFDADGDGTPDAFVCADGPEDGDSDSDEDLDEGLDEHSEDDQDHDEDDDEDHDEDDDGVDDDIDCDVGD